MPKGRIYHDHAYKVNTPCDIERDFNEKKARDRWVKIHQSQCEICRKALILTNVNNQGGRMFAMNDEQRIRSGYFNAYEIISRTTS